MGLAVAPGVGAALDDGDGHRLVVAEPEVAMVVGDLDARVRPRWVCWSQHTAAALLGDGVRLATCWDLAAAHRLLAGGWAGDPARVWALAHGLDPAAVPTGGPADLFSTIDAASGDPGAPVRPDGHLRPDWAAGAWADGPDPLLEWAGLAVEVARRQHDRLAALTERPLATRTARAESTAELLAAELRADGLPVDRAAMEATLAGLIGPRPRSPAEAAEQRARRDAAVLDLLPAGSTFDLRSPGQVRSLLRRVGVEVADTRAWRLEALRDAHPVVEALLAWRKAERIATTFGYAWLDEHLGADGRFRGAWSGSDGAAGRMTASAGLHNMPAVLRRGVVAEAGHVFVRSDLGQIEPRVLAAVAGDRALAAASEADDLYRPVAERLGVDRDTAKVAVLGAMYGQTSGHGAQALAGLRSAYPVSIRYLEDAASAAEGGRHLRTHGGRLVPMGSGSGATSSDREARSAAAARGRYGRNAMVQGAAAELFKQWAVTVRARGVELGARVVMCLHDELLVHVPAEHRDEAAALVDDCLHEAAVRWDPGGAVRFLADTSVIDCWADAKG